MVFVEGIAVSGDYIVDIKDKHFHIVSKPKYELVPKINQPDETEKKLIILIELTDGSMLDYYPNKTSIKTMCKLWGYEMDNWMGKRFLFVTILQKIAGNDRNVLYVADKKIE